jgi:hypothetical protein
MTPTDLTVTSPEPDQRTERIRRLLGALYREEARAAAYRAFRRSATEEPLQKMLDTYLQVETRFIGILERHLAELGVGRPGRVGILRRVLRGLGGATGAAIAWRGSAAILRRAKAEEWSGAQRYGKEIDWPGWSALERWSLDGHRCDQLYQSHWAGDVARDRAAAGGSRAGS